MKKNLISAAVVALLGFSSLSAHAGMSNASLYAGASVGTTSYSYISESASGFKAFVGVPVANDLTVEAAYLSQGEIGSAVKFSVSGFQVSVLSAMPIEDNLSIFGKVGVYMWEAEFKSSFGTDTIDDVDLTYAIGANYMLSDEIDVRAEYELIKLNELDADMLSVGVSFSF